MQVICKSEFKKKNYMYVAIELLRSHIHVQKRN